MFRTGKALAAQRPLRRALFLAAALLLLWLGTQYLSPATPPPSVTAADAAVEGETEMPRLRSSSSSFRPGYVLAVVLLAGGGAFALYLRKKTGAAATGKDLLQPLARIPLGPGQQLHLVSCGDDVLLLGATGSQITLLKTMPGESAETIQSTETEPEPEPSARGYRHRSVVGSQPAPATANTPVPATTFSEVMRRLNLSQHSGSNA